jgi:hypothetical protein
VEVSEAEGAVAVAVAETVLEIAEEEVAEVKRNSCGIKNIWSFEWPRLQITEFVSLLREHFFGGDFVCR